MLMKHGYLKKSVADGDLLEETFLRVGEKNGLDRKILIKILEILDRDKFLPMGQRTHVKTDLEKAIRKYIGEETA